MRPVRRFFALAFYYGLCRYLPSSTFLAGGRFFKWLRYLCCKSIFESCGRNVNVERLAFFGSGRKIRVGDNSGLGINCEIPPDTIIGKNVMMAPNVYIVGVNHQFDRIDIPMCEQGATESKQTIIEDDIWIGRQVIFTPGRTVKKGSIIAAGTVLTKDFPEYSIVGGNPGTLIRSRAEALKKGAE
jgi:maltose O-acetyltransferase